MTNEPSSGFQDAVREGKRHVGVLLDQSGNLIDSASSQANELADRLLAYTKKNPVTALLLAAAAGVVLLGTLKALESRR